MADNLYTVRELLNLLRQKNKIQMPILMTNDVAYLVVQKSSIEDFVKDLPPDAKSPWSVYGERDGIVTLDVQD